MSKDFPGPRPFRLPQAEIEAVRFVKSLEVLTGEYPFNSSGNDAGWSHLIGRLRLHLDVLEASQEEARQIRKKAFSL